MKRILTAVVLIAVVLFVVLKGPDWLFSLGLGAFAFAAAYEYLDLVAQYGFKPFKVLTLSLVALPFVCLGGLSVLPMGPEGSALSEVAAVVLFTFLFAPVLLLIPALWRRESTKALPDVASSAFAIPYTAVPFLCLLIIRSRSGGVFYLLFLFAVVWC